MGRAPCCSKVGLRRGPWTLKEDDLLIHYIQTHGEGHWRSLPKKAGLLRCGKSCRLRWMNYLRPDIKRGNITPDEEDLIIRLHSLLGNRWALIAGRLPGRTDNEIKNYWNSHLSKRIEPGKSRRTSSSSSSSENKGAKGLGKRRKSNTMNTMKHNNGAEEIMKITKVKAHQPKAIRVSISPTSVLRVESNSSFDNRVASGIPVSLEAGNEGLTSRTGDASGYVNIPIDSDYDILSSWNPCHDDIDRLLLPGAPSKKAMLEKVFEEYQEVLMAEDHVQLESFLDSLWI